jgi:hypothetical protein
MRENRKGGQEGKEIRFVPSLAKTTTIITTTIQLTPSSSTPQEE